VRRTLSQVLLSAARTWRTGRVAERSTPTLPPLPSPGDFTVDRRLLFIAAIAVVVGAGGAGLALCLIRLIGLFTNLFYYGRFSFAFSSPSGTPFGPAAAIVPVVGGLLIGLMARYGSERIRGHGIPEAMEAILIGGSRMQPRVALLKPISSAVAIGSGGPFGAEGPIIMTGGALGSIIAQGFHLTASERKTLLVAGAAAGMAATFATPFAAALLAVELLLFEWKPRSLVPVALAVVTAVLIRPWLLGSGPLFPIVPHPAQPPSAFAFAVFVGIAAGILSVVLTVGVYAAEDAFNRLPFHWMWWPALGGVAIGVGGLLQPHALGVGYDVIGSLLAGRYVEKALVGLIAVKALIWAISLGSGSSGGVLAPLLLMGGALGALESAWSPGGDKSLWPLVSMAAVLGGTMRSPLTAVAFAVELTHDLNVLPVLMVASVCAHGFTVLVLKRSILTEKVARRGYHLSREYSVDPLEQLTIGEVMTREPVCIPAAMSVRELLDHGHFGGRSHQGYPVVGEDGTLVGVITRSDLLRLPVEPAENAPARVGDLLEKPPIVAYTSESCRLAAERMAQEGVGRLPVLSHTEPGKVVGIVTRSDLLKPRARSVLDEIGRERFLGPRARAARQQRR
jgi:H+/Cl- antiporter ClcA